MYMMYPVTSGYPVLRDWMAGQVEMVGKETKTKEKL